jgi:hypothetical protein
MKSEGRHSGGYDIFDDTRCCWTEVEDVHTILQESIWEAGDSLAGLEISERV